MAGEQTTRINRSLSIGGITVGGTINTLSHDGAVSFQKQIPANSTNVEIDVPVTIANVISMGIEADHDCTVLANSTSAPTETLNLKAHSPLLYDGVNDPASVKFLTHDLVKLYVTTGANLTTLKFAAGVDDTPGLTG